MSDDEIVEKLKQLTNDFRTGLDKVEPEINKLSIKAAIETDTGIYINETTNEKLEQYIEEYNKFYSKLTNNNLPNDVFIDCRRIYIVGNFSSEKFKEIAPIRFDNSTFRGHCVFSSREFKGYAHFKDTTFEKGADFSNSSFFGKVTFNIDDVFKKHLNFSNAKFKEETVFKFNSGSSKSYPKNREINFSDTVFSNTVSFDESSFDNVSVSFKDTIFKQSASFNKTSFENGVDFSNAKFHSSASFKEIKKFSGIVNFTNVCFKCAPLFHESELPQETYFTNAKFNTTKQDVVAFRLLRKTAANHKNQQDELMFFALEQRAIRKLNSKLEQFFKYLFFSGLALDAESLIRWLSHEELMYLIAFSFLLGLTYFFTEWLISLGYDWISEYGNSPKKAMICFIVFNILMTFSFYKLFEYCPACNDTSHVIYDKSCLKHDYYSTMKIENPATSLVLQNLVNPTGLFTQKALIVVNDFSLMLLSLFQASFSYIILLLLALAIRGKFQKGSGGDK